MTERTLVSAEVFEEDNQFFFTLDGGASRSAPYQTQEAAVEAVSELLTSSFEDLTKTLLTGDSK